MMLLQVLQATTDAGCLRKFLSLHGLRLLWSWMADSADLDSEEVMQFRIQVCAGSLHTHNYSLEGAMELKFAPFCSS